MKELEITKGEFKIVNKVYGKLIEYRLYNLQSHEVVIDGLWGKEGKANAELYKDAHETSNQCNLLPSELLKQNKILMTALSVLLEEINEGAEINKTSQFFGSSERHLAYFRKALNQTK